MINHAQTDRGPIGQPDGSTADMGDPLLSLPIFTGDQENPIWFIDGKGYVNSSNGSIGVEPPTRLDTPSRQQAVEIELAQWRELAGYLNNGGDIMATDAPTVPHENEKVNPYLIDQTAHAVGRAALAGFLVRPLS